MNKAELIDAMSSVTKLSKTDCKKAIEAFIETVAKALRKNKSVVLTNFGTFSVSLRNSRMGVNPSTGQKMKIPAKKVPKFKAGKRLRAITQS